MSALATCLHVNITAQTYSFDINEMRLCPSFWGDMTVINSDDLSKQKI